MNACMNKRDRQTDRQTNGIAISISVPTRNKNVTIGPVFETQCICSVVDPSASRDTGLNFQGTNMPFGENANERCRVEENLEKGYNGKITNEITEMS